MQQLILSKRSGIVKCAINKHLTPAQGGQARARCLFEDWIPAERGNDKLFFGGFYCYCLCFFAFACVIDFGPFRALVFDNLDTGDGRSVNGEDAFDADARGDFPHSDSRVYSLSVLDRDDLAVKHLHAVAVTGNRALFRVDDRLFDFLVDANHLTAFELGQVGLEVGLGEFFDVRHINRI